MERGASGMKIYNKSSFIAGVVCVGALVLLVFLHADWWQWLISIAIAARFLYVGLTEAGSRRTPKINKHYKDVATTLHGKHYALKTNLPLVFAGAFFAVAVLLRFVFDIYLPVWSYVVFVIILAVLVAYSIGIEKSITDYIDDNIPEDDERER